MCEVCHMSLIACIWQLMEIERVKALKHAEEKESSIVAVRRKRAGEIKDQIVERQNQRLIDGIASSQTMTAPSHACAEELKDQETHAMLAAMEKLRIEEIEQTKRKKEHGKKLLGKM